MLTSLGVFHKAIKTRSQNLMKLDIAKNYCSSEPRTYLPVTYVSRSTPSIYLLAAINQGTCALDKFTTRLLLHFIKVVEIDSEQEVGQVRLVSTINKLAYHCE